MTCFTARDNDIHHLDTARDTFGYRRFGPTGDVPLGWSHGGAVVQALTVKRPALIRRLIVAGSGPGTVPDLPPTDPRVFEVMGRSTATADDQNFLF